MQPDKIHSKTNQLFLPLNKSKPTTLSPYINEIQRRKKFKSVTKPRNKIRNDSSEKSFRIREKSTTSLLGKTLQSNPYFTHKHQNDDNDSIVLNKLKTIKITPNGMNNQTNERSFQSAFGKGMEKQQRQNHKSDRQLFNELYSKIQEKCNQKKQKKTFQRSIHKYNIDNEDKNSIAKTSYVKIGFLQKSKQDKFQKETIHPIKEKTEEIVLEKKKPKNLRKNKYQALHNSVTAQCINHSPAQQAAIDPTKSQNKFVIQKKQSNVSLNKDMDDLAERQMRKFYRQLRGSEIEKSVQKSTEKYLCETSYRPLKSKNDIDIYVSTISQLPKHKISRQSTINTSKKHSIFQSSLKQSKKQQNIIQISHTGLSNYQKGNKDYLSYDFDFVDDDKVMQKPSAIQQQSVNSSQKDLTFQQQRKKAEVDYFHKGEIEVQWSEEDCQIQID